MILLLRSEREQDLEIKRMFSLRNKTSTDYGVASQLSKRRVALHDCYLLLVWRNGMYMVRKHRDRAATLPDLYAKNNATQRPLAILNRQMGELRTYYKKCGPRNLPL